MLRSHDGAKEALRKVVAQVFEAPVIVKAVVQHYSQLNSTAIKYLRTADDKQLYDLFCEKAVGGDSRSGEPTWNFLQLLSQLPARDEAHRVCVLRWASRFVKPITEIVRSHGAKVSQLREQLKKPDDTDLFLRVFSRPNYRSAAVNGTGPSDWRKMLQTVEQQFERKN